MRVVSVRAFAAPCRAALRCAAPNCNPPHPLRPPPHRQRGRSVAAWMRRGGRGRGQAILSLPDPSPITPRSLPDPSPIPPRSLPDPSCLRADVGHKFFIVLSGSIFIYHENDKPKPEPDKPPDPHQTTPAVCQPKVGKPVSVAKDRLRAPPEQSAGPEPQRLSLPFPDRETPGGGGDSDGAADGAGDAATEDGSGSPSCRRRRPPVGGEVRRASLIASRRGSLKALGVKKAMGGGRGRRASLTLQQQQSPEPQPQPQPRSSFSFARARLDEGAAFGEIALIKHGAKRTATAEAGYNGARGFNCTTLALYYTVLPPQQGTTGPWLAAVSAWP